MNALLEYYPQEVQKILLKYPAEQKRAAILPLLYLAQRALGYITRQTLTEIAEITGVSPTDVASLVGFYSLFHDEQGGEKRIQVCTDLPCALRGAENFLRDLCVNLSIQVGETTADGLVTVEAVTCLAGCDKVPLFQVQAGDGLRYYENQSVESALALVEEWRQNRRTPTEQTHLPEAVKPAASQGVTSVPLPERIQLQELGGQ